MIDDGANSQEPSSARRALFRAPISVFQALGALIATACEAGDAGPEAEAEAPANGTRPLEPGDATRDAAAAARPDQTEEKPRDSVADGGASAGKVPPAEPSGGVTGADKPTKCARPTTFEPFVDLAPRTSFRSTKDSTTLDWVTVAVSMSLQLVSLPERLFGWLRQLEALELGYPTNLLMHSLQTATRARRAGASDDLVLAALCHRLGMAFTIEGYGELSAAFLRGYVSEEVYHLVRHCEVYAPLPAGRKSGDLRARYQTQSWHADAVRLADEWATPFYDPRLETLGLADFAELATAKLGGTTHDPYLTRVDCFQPQVAP